MKLKFTIEEFTEKANKTHNNFYDYSEVNYVNSRIKIKIICPLHEKFEQSPEKHIKGQGCPKCRYIKSGNSKKSSHEYFVNQLKIRKIFDKFNYLTEYKKSHEKIKIQCKKCNFIFNQKPTSHLSGSGCPKCSGKNKTILNFIEDSKKVHGDKYDYSLLEKKLVLKKQKIICKKHGIFEQNISEHISGHGCKKCGIEKRAQNTRNFPVGWSHNIWKKAGENSKHFDSFKVYIIECWGKNEHFYKIGKTFKTVKDRFYTSDMSYKYKVIKIITGNSLDISKLEIELKKLNKKHKYLPKIKFKGMYECFNQIAELMDVFGGDEQTTEFDMSLFVSQFASQTSLAPTQG